MNLPFDDNMDVILTYELSHEDDQVIVCNQFDMVANALHHMGFCEEAHWLSGGFISPDLNLTYSLNELCEKIIGKAGSVTSLHSLFCAHDLNKDFDVLS